MPLLSSESKIVSVCPTVIDFVGSNFETKRVTVVSARKNGYCCNTCWLLKFLSGGPSVQLQYKGDTLTQRHKKLCRRSGEVNNLFQKEERWAMCWGFKM